MLLTIQPHMVHVWLVELSHCMADENALHELLSPDEVTRAMRFQSALHRSYFIIIRGLLRKTVSRYTDISADKIVFSYGLHGKPYLLNNPYFLEFNVSHSAGIAIFALTNHQQIGVDVEKIKPTFNEKIAKRYFSTNEYEELMSLSDHERVDSFYQLWTRKEALIKARGEGIFTQSSFALNTNYCIQNLDVPASYAAAVAMNDPIENIIYHFCR